jgi:hypothetical protein
MPSFIPTVNTANVLTGPCKAYTQVYNSSVPPVTPLDSLALGAAWLAPWTPIGATEAGVTLSFKRSTDKITIDEQVTPVDMRTKEVTFSLDIELSEDTIAAMLLAYGGGGITTVPASSGVRGTQTLSIATDMTYFAFGFEGVNAYGFWRRVIVPITVSVGSAKTTYQRSKKQRTYATSFESLVAPESVVIREMTANALP